MKYIDADKLKAEIEKLKTFYGELHTDFVCEALLSFLSTIESEKPMNLENDLEEEIKRYGEKNMFNIPAFQQVARHFAEWGAEHLKK